MRVTNLGNLNNLIKKRKYLSACLFNHFRVPWETVVSMESSLFRLIYCLLFVYKVYASKYHIQSIDIR